VAERQSYTNTCERCGEQFHPFHRLSKFCSKDCRYMAQGPTALPNPWSSVAPTCPQCDRSDEMYRWIADKSHWYCSICKFLYTIPEGEVIGGQGQIC
jgi:hypothetical protein